MIGVDTNILVAAHRRDHEWHERAAARVRELAEGSAQWAIPWACLHEFLAIVTHPRIFRPPTSLEQAIDQVDAWHETRRLILISEPAGYWQTLCKNLTAGRMAGPRVHDARVAATCVINGVSELWTADRDFSRMSGLKVRNPLLD